MTRDELESLALKSSLESTIALAVIRFGVGWVHALADQIERTQREAMDAIEAESDAAARAKFGTPPR